MGPMSDVQGLWQGGRVGGPGSNVRGTLYSEIISWIIVTCISNSIIIVSNSTVHSSAGGTMQIKRASKLSWLIRCISLFQGTLNYP